MTPPYRFVLALATPLLLLGACKSADHIMFQPSPASLTERLPSLDVAVEATPLLHAAGAQPDDPQKLFEREVRMHLSDPEDTVRYGTAQLRVTECTARRTGRVLQGIQMVTFMLPSLLGVPLEWYESDLRATLQIISTTGDTLVTYRGRGQSRIRVAMYHGYSQTQANRVADLAALREALNQIKWQLDNDAGRVRSQLLATGPRPRTAADLRTGRGSAAAPTPVAAK